jgi:hypothetical protein
MLCSLLGRNRQAYYWRLAAGEKDVFGTELLVQEVIRIRRDLKRVGGRKLYLMTQVFREEHGIAIGRDAFFEVLREEELLIRKRRSGRPRTTFSCWWKKKYPNLIRDYIPTGANQVWVSDITYVRVGTGFCYLSLITDAYSRKIVGHCLYRDLSSKGCVKALKMALGGNPRRRGLIHHSDRGSQYYSDRYTKLLGPIRISMSEKSDPLENAIAERVNGILKDELLDESYESYHEASTAVDRAVSSYNHLRPHSSVEMLTPAEAHTRQGQLQRHWKNYYTQKGPLSPQAMA